MRIIDADEFLIDESEAYITAQNRINDSLTRKVNLVVHKKIQKLIADAPTVDAEPIRHGEWRDMGVFETCSVCRGTHLKGVKTMCGKAIWIKSKYCPNCGAKMDGGGMSGND